MEDAAIIELYVSRDENAITQTSQKYGSYCLAIANRILNSQEDAEEYVNDTWLKAWNLIPPTIPKYLHLFLAKLTRNLSFDKYRKEHSKKRGGGELSFVMEEMEEVIADSNTVETEYERKELVAAINTYLHSLPLRECNIFLRRYFYMESVMDIAKRYDMSQSHVSMTLSRTRKKLKVFLRKEYGV